MSAVWNPPSAAADRKRVNENYLPVVGSVRSTTLWLHNDTIWAHVCRLGSLETYKFVLNVVPFYCDLVVLIVFQHGIH